MLYTYKINHKLTFKKYIYMYIFLFKLEEFSLIFLNMKPKLHKNVNIVFEKYSFMNYKLYI